jgi:hypothetical protein
LFAMTTEPLDASYKIGRRFKCIDSEDKGLIHYIGHVHISKNAKAVYLGVEWYVCLFCRFIPATTEREFNLFCVLHRDDESRGKHDGEVDGKRYYSCPPKQGAFIHPGRVKMGKTFVEALNDKYGAEFDNVKGR